MLERKMTRHPGILRALCGSMLGLLLLIQGCASLPSLADRPSSSSVAPARDSRLGRAIVPLTEAHPDRSGIVPLKRGRDAFASRVLLADVAERSLDVQYYIWHADLSGTLLFEACVRAADRGVRVRLLLDDNNTCGLDAIARRARRAAQHRGAALQPLRAARGSRSLGFLTDFERLNRRMHNKSFTVDNQATDRRRPQRRRRVLRGRRRRAVRRPRRRWRSAPVVADVSSEFDRYWESDSAYPGRAHRRAGRAVGRAPRSTARAQRSVEQSAAAARVRRRDRANRRLDARPARATGSRSNGRRCSWSATTRPRRLGPAPRTACCGCAS